MRLVWFIIGLLSGGVIGSIFGFMTFALISIAGYERRNSVEDSSRE